jgi:hypothetical protein
MLMHSSGTGSPRRSRTTVSLPLKTRKRLEKAKQFEEEPVHRTIDNALDAVDLVERIKAEDPALVDRVKRSAVTA